MPYMFRQHISKLAQRFIDWNYAKDLEMAMLHNMKRSEAIRIFKEEIKEFLKEERLILRELEPFVKDEGKKTFEELEWLLNSFAYGGPYYVTHEKKVPQKQV